MDAVTLNYWLSKFVIEVAKKSGERYPRNTVYEIVAIKVNYIKYYQNPTSGLLTMLRSDWLSYYKAIFCSPLVGKSAGFENQNNSG